MTERLALAWFISLACFGCFGVSEAGSGDGSEGASPTPANYCVLLHSPGPAWKEGIPFREQPGVADHVRYMRRQLENGLIVMGGPFLDDSGGMMICREPDLERARSLAEADPAVRSGLLTVIVRPWMAAMSSVRPIETTADPGVEAPERGD